MRSVPGLLPVALAAGLAILPGAPGGVRVPVRVEPPGCKPEPPFSFEVRAVPLGPRVARIEAKVCPLFDAERIEVDAATAAGAVVGPPARAGGVHAGETCEWRGLVHLAPGEAGARVLVRARATFAPPGRATDRESVAAFREVVVGDPPPVTPGRLLRAGDVETVEVPAVRVR